MSKLSSRMLSVFNKNEKKDFVILNEILIVYTINEIIKIL